MSSALTTMSPALAVAVARRAEAETAERDVMRAALAYAHAHPVPGMGEEDAAYGDQSLELAGPGAPEVSEYAMAEFAAAMGMSTTAGRRYLGQTLEVAHRLPRLWARLEADEVPAWRARTIADATSSLSAPAAAYVDGQVAALAGEIGPTRLARIIDQAVLLSEEPEMDRVVDSDSTRSVDIRLRTATTSGVAFMDASLDLSDALDLERALQTAAAAMKDAGNEDPLDVRRSMALGEIARTYLAQNASGEGTGAVQLYVHYRPGSDQARNGFADLENTRDTITTHQLIRWCTRAGATVRVTPVIDLNEPISSAGYSPSGRLREQVILRDATCVFPHCDRAARRADLDHISPWDSGGSTTTDNLAPLCRTHHRYKTHAGWSYAMLGPGVYRWTSPAGEVYLRDGMTTTARFRSA